MHDLNDYRLFFHVVEQRGFTAAGKVLGLPKSRLSLRIKALEARLGVRLLQRTSRRFGITEAGEELYRHAVSVLRAVDEAEYALKRRAEHVTGTIRCTSTAATLEYALRGIVASFLKRYPAVNVFFHATSRMVDVVGDQYDVAIRAHHESLADSSLIQRPLVPAPWHVLASPEYVAAHGMPLAPADLTQHSALCVWRPGVPPAWCLHDVKSPHPVVNLPLLPRLMTDDMGSLKAAVMAGVGLSALPAYVCREETRCGALVRVLPEWTAGASTISALLPSRQGMPLSLRAFVNHVAAELPAAIA